MQEIATQMLVELAPCFSGEVRRQWPGVFCTLAKHGVVWMLTAFCLDGWTGETLDAMAEAFGVPDETKLHTTENGCRVTMQWEVE